MAQDVTYQPLSQYTTAERFALMFGHIKPKIFDPMSLSTSILGPYDDTPTAEKTVISACVPPEVKERLFTDFLTRRGAVDKVITRQIFVIDGYLAKYPHLKALEDRDKEKVINNLLNAIVEFVDNLDDKQQTIPQTNDNDLHRTK